MAKQPTVPDDVPAVGSMAPDFELPADNGETVPSAIRASAWCSTSIQRIRPWLAQACGFRDNYRDHRAQCPRPGHQPDGVNSRAVQDQVRPAFPASGGRGSRVAELCGAWGEEQLRKKYMGIIRSHFVIDEDGRIIEAQHKVSPETVQNALATLRL
jgi:peroxiredoxin Q/BCP